MNSRKNSTVSCYILDLNGQYHIFIFHFYCLDMKMLTPSPIFITPWTTANIYINICTPLVTDQEPSEQEKLTVEGKLDQGKLEHGEC